MAAAIAPGLHAQPVDDTVFVRDPAEKQALASDPLVDHFDLPAASAAAAVRGIERVEYRANTAVQGGATDIYLSRASFVDCVVEENVASQGGGIYIDGESSITVTTTDFGEGATDNSADDVFNAATGQGFFYGVDATFSCQPGTGCQ